MNYALSLHNLSCGYDPNHPVLSNLTLSIDKGEIVAILGLNGSGKSTLIKTMIGIAPPLSGEIHIDGDIAFVPQSFSSTFDYSVLEIVLMGAVGSLGIFSHPSKEDKENALKYLAYLGIESLAETSINQLSGGQQQLVLFARALNSERNILLLDEPTSALDLHNQRHILSLMKMLSESLNKTIVFTTHDPQHALEIAHRTLILSEDSLKIDHTERLLTEDTLSHLYQTEMKIIMLEKDDSSKKVIIPLF